MWESTLWSPKYYEKKAPITTTTTQCVHCVMIWELSYLCTQNVTSLFFFFSRTDFCSIDLNVFQMCESMLGCAVLWNHQHKNHNDRCKNENRNPIHIDAIIHHFDDYVERIQFVMISDFVTNSELITRWKWKNTQSARCVIWVYYKHTSLHFLSFVASFYVFFLFASSSSSRFHHRFLCGAVCFFFQTLL